MSKRSVAVIMASFCTVLIGFSIRNSYGILLPEMLPSLKISKTEAGLIYGSFFMAYTAFSPVLGLLADRMNIRLLLTSFSVILGIGALLMGYSSSLMEAVFSFMLAGIGASACWSPLVPLVTRWISDKRKGIALAFVDGGASIGIALTSIIMPLVVMAFNWRMGWKTLGVLAVIIAGINFLLVRDYPIEKSNLQDTRVTRHTNKPTITTYMRILGNSTFLILGLSYLFIGFSTIIPLAFITTYAVQELMLRYDVATRLITVMAIASIMGKLVLGYLSDRLGRIETIILCEILIATGNLGVVCLSSSSALYLSVAILGFGQGAIWSLYALCAPDYFSKSSAGFIVGFWTVFLGIGFTLSPIIAGWVADLTQTFLWSFTLAITTAILSISLLFLVRKRVSSVSLEVAHQSEE